jgi:serine/threonine protein phosphatase PrpC
MFKTAGIREALEKTMLELESKILQWGAQLGSGSCATVLVLKDNEYVTANIGDSRILIVRDMDECCQVTEDHKPENPLEKSRIEHLGGKIYRVVTTNPSNGEKYYGPYRVHPSKLSVSRSLGDYLIKRGQTEKLISSEADFTSGKLEHGDVVLLMSDGGY